MKSLKPIFVTVAIALAVLVVVFRSPAKVRTLLLGV